MTHKIGRNPLEKYIFESKKKTKKHGNYSYKQNLSPKLHSQNVYINKLISSYFTSKQLDNIPIDDMIVLRPYHNHNHTHNHTHNQKQNYINKPLIQNYIHGLEDVLQMKVLKEKFKTFFTLDYMNYINLDANKRLNEISTNVLTYQNHPIILEGYLAITITFENPNKDCTFNSYMFDKLKILTKDKSRKLNFTENLPKNFPTENNKIITKVDEIINQAYTIIKYISIILAHQIKSNLVKVKGINSFEIIKVHMMLHSDMSLILNKCIIKKNWESSQIEDNKLLNWLNKIYFINVIHRYIKKTSNKNKSNRNSKKQILGFSGLPLYKHELLNRYKKYDNKVVYAKNLERNDFDNNFIIISSEYITKNTFTFNQFLIDNFKKYNLKFQDFYSTIGTKPALIFFSLEENIENDIVAQHYNTLAYCANTLASLQNINNKSTLFYLSKKLYPTEYNDFLAESFDLRRDTEYKPGKIYIVRPVRAIDPKTKKKLIVAHSGKDIMYVTDAKTLEAAKKLLISYDTVLVSDYIRNPLLFKGRKFHIRIFYIIVYENSTLKTYLFKDSYFMTAAKPFILDKFDDKDIHDSHFDTTDDFYPYDTSLNTENIGQEITPEMRAKLWQDIRDIMTKMSNLLVYGETGVKLYDNHKNGFKIEGVDIMVLDNMQPILIECNTKPGFKVKSAPRAKKMHDKLHLNLLKFVNEIAIEPIFGIKREYSQENKDKFKHEQYIPLFTKRMD